jgi:hypothetical protein
MRWMNISMHKMEWSNDTAQPPLRSNMVWQDRSLFSNLMSTQSTADEGFSQASQKSLAAVRPPQSHAKFSERTVLGKIVIRNLSKPSKESWAENKSNLFQGSTMHSFLQWSPFVWNAPGVARQTLQDALERSRWWVWTKALNLPNYYQQVEWDFTMQPHLWSNESATPLLWKIKPASIRKHKIPALPMHIWSHDCLHN